MLFEYVYQTGIWFLKIAMRLAALFITKVKMGVDGRKGLIENLGNKFPGLCKGRDVAWFHAASLGEFEQGRPVIEAFRKDYPDFFIVLTFFSPSGFEVRKNYPGVDYICYLPLDSAKNARRFVEILKPKIVFFIKYEFWFNYLKELRNSGAIIISFSTIFRPEQVFFKSYGSFYRRLLKYFDHILVQNSESFNLLKSIGITKCTVAGDTRFDRVKSIASAARDLPEIATFIGHSTCMVAGSVWQADMDVLIPALNHSKLILKTIIAPHEIKKEQIESWREALDGKSVLYSHYVREPSNKNFDYLIIDNIGMLSSLYRYGNIAYIGGSFGSGLHNILEAATFGLPILFGNKKYQKFQEAIDLIEQGGALAVGNASEMGTLLNQLTEDMTLGEKMGQVNQNYVISLTGATNLVMKEVERFFNT